MAEKTEVRNIYEKISAIKMKLLGIKKSGNNEFSKYTYFELGDILTVLIPALHEERLFMKTEFSATEQTAKLIICEIDNTNNRIEFETHVGSCTLKASHDIQNLGAAQTYTRRYLIMTAFDIAETDIVDGGAEKEDKKQEKKNPSPKNQQPPAPKPESQQQLDPPVPQDLTKLKRSIWELLKKLPVEQQSEWLNQCKDADEQTLMQIFEDVDSLLFRNMYEEVLSLIKKLPEESRSGWSDAVQGVGPAKLEEIFIQLREVVAIHEETNKQLSKPKPAPQEKEKHGQELADLASQESEAPQDVVSAEELDIF